MIVFGLDVHKQSVTAVWVDDLGRSLAETRGPVDAQVIAWASSLGEERLWAVEDCGRRRAARAAAAGRG